MIVFGFTFFWNLWGVVLPMVTNEKVTNEKVDNVRCYRAVLMNGSTPLCIPNIEVAFSNDMWWSIPQEISAELFAKFQDGQNAGYKWDWGDSRKGAWKHDGEDISINRYTIDLPDGHQEA